MKRSVPVLAPESVLVGYDKKSQELFMVQPLEELEDDLELRISLLNRCVCCSLPLHLLTIPQSPNPIPHHQPHGCPRLRLPARRPGPHDVQGPARPREYQGEPRAVARQGRMARRRARKMESKYVNVSLPHPTANLPPTSVLNHTPDPLAAALAKSTVASLSLSPASLPTQPDYLESTNPTSPSSPGKTPGETLVDFKYSLTGASSGKARHRTKSYQRPAPGDELRCAMVVYAPPVVDAVASGPGQGQKGRAQQVVESKDVEPPLMRGNTVAGYWELSRQVRLALLSQRTTLIPSNSSSARCRPTSPTSPHGINPAHLAPRVRPPTPRPPPRANPRRSEMSIPRHRYPLIHCLRPRRALASGRVSRSVSLAGIACWVRMSSLRIASCGTMS